MSSYFKILQYIFNLTSTPSTLTSTMSPPTTKRCLYEVLNLEKTCTADEIRSAYKKLALQRHPDKLIKSGVSDAEATAAFQELVNAYEVLSDAKERAWYDANRSRILFSGERGEKGGVPDLYEFFSKACFSGYDDTGKGFYKVYSDVFDKIYSNELNFAKKMGLGADAVKEAPVMGNLRSPYTQVTAFYNYWQGFATVMDFCWADQYDAVGGMNRKSRRYMEEENKKVRKKARKEYNDTVRSLAEFVKKRDKRVIDMQLKRNEEMEKKREEEKRKRKEMQREKLERAMAYEEPEWAKAEDDGEVEEDDNEIEDDKKNEANELFCVVCRKKFKSEKQWKNHEQSKKHKEKVAELREGFSDEKEEEVEKDTVDELNEKFGESFQFQDQNNGVEEVQEDSELTEKFEESFEFQNQNNGYEKAQEDTVYEPAEKFEESFQCQEQNNGDEKTHSTEEEADSGDRDFCPTKVKESVPSDDDEAGILEAMLSGRKGRKIARAPKSQTSTSKTSTLEGDEDMDFMAYNNLKKTRRRRRASKKSEHDEAAATIATTSEDNSQVEEAKVQEDDDKTTTHSFVGKDNSVEDVHPSGKVDIPKHPSNKKDTDKKEISKSKNSSKGKKQKATSKSSGSVCDTCGVDFESRNKLYIHLGDTGHATLKSR